MRFFHIVFCRSVFIENVPATVHQGGIKLVPSGGEGVLQCFKVNIEGQRLPWWVACDDSRSQTYARVLTQQKLEYARVEGRKRHFARLKKESC